MDEASARSLVDLLRGAQRGDSEALNTLLSRVREPLARSLRRRLGSRPHLREVAEDILQEVMRLVVLHIGECHATSDAQVMAWLLVILRNQIVTWARANLPRILATCSLAVDVEASLGPNIDDEDEPRDAVWETILAIVQRGFDGLSPLTRELVTAHVLEETTWPELAERFGTTPGGVRRRYQRARDRMRTSFWKELYELPEEVRSSVVARLSLNR